MPLNPYDGPMFGQCARCGGVLSALHYCPAMPQGVPTNPVRYVTEDDVRRIIREELEAHFANEPSTHNP